MTDKTNGGVEGVESGEVVGGNEEKLPPSAYLSRDTVEELAQYFNDTKEDDLHSDFSLGGLLVGSEDYESGVEADKEASLDDIDARREVPEGFAEAMSNLYQEILDNGFDGTKDDFRIRWVGTDNPGNLSRIIDEAKSDDLESEDGIDMSMLGPEADDNFAEKLNQAKRVFC